MNYFYLVILLFFMYSCSVKEYDARINDYEILTPLPKKSPKINGPKIYGARPEKDFLYRIPCQGERPISFEIEGLPSGLHCNSEGIIYGKTPSAAGNYLLKINAKNKFGSCSRSFKLVIGEKMALTPPTGWNTWGGYMLNISDSLIRSVADFFVEKGLADVGYQYLGLDDCWMRISPEQYESLPLDKKKQHEGFDYTKVVGDVRDNFGNILPNEKFPDIKKMVDYIHSKGLKVGIYSSPGEVTCQGWAGSFGHEEQDAKTYSDWGIDLIKYDLCSGRYNLEEIRKSNPNFSQKEFWEPMVTYIKNQNRDILFNLCQYGKEEPWKWAPGLGIETWRCTGDLNHKVEDYFNSALRIALELSDYVKPGHWNDPDFMYIDKIRNVKKMNDLCVSISLDTNQRYQYVTLWSMICAPFFFSCNIEMMDEFTLRLLSNTNLMNINQDELGLVAEVIRNNQNEVIMLKKLSDGSKAIAIFNRSDQEEIVSLSWNEIGLANIVNVYDAWRMINIGNFADGINTKLSSNGVVLYIVN